MKFLNLCISDNETNTEEFGNAVIEEINFEIEEKDLESFINKIKKLVEELK